MPYIPEHRRPVLDALVEHMGDVPIQVDGDLNYLLFAFFKRCVPMTYYSTKNFCGELHQCATEIERRLLGPYEDKKIEENGDVL